MGLIWAYFNKSIGKGKCPYCLKLANITPVFKKNAHTSKNNYRSMSILPVSSKTLEKLLQKQLLVFFDNILSKFQRSFREFAKLRALRAFIPYVPSRLTRLRTFAPYAPSYLRALCAFGPYVS